MNKDRNAEARLTNPPFRWSSILLWAGVLPLVVTSVFLIARIHSYVALVASVDRSEAAISEAHRLLAILEDAETGQRGYLLTRDRAFLAPYNNALQYWDFHVQLLRKPIGGEPAQEKRLRELEVAAREQFSILRETITERERGDPPADTISKEGDGKRSMDGVRRIAAALTTAESARFDTLSRQRDRALLEVYILSCSTLALAFFCCLIVVIRQFRKTGEERFQLIANSIPQLAWMADKDGSIFWYNQRWYDYTGTTFQQMKGQGWRTVHDPRMLPEVLARKKISLDTGKPFEMEFPLRGVDGSFRTFMTRMVPVKQKTGQPILWVGTNTDVEDHRRVEERLRRLYDSGITGVFYWKADGSISEANDKFLEIVGYTREDLLAGIVGWARMTPAEYVAQDEAVLAELKKGLAIKPIEKEFYRKDGSRIHLEVGAALLAAHSEDGVAFVLDITQRKEAEANFVDLNQTLDQRVSVRTAELAESNRKLAESQANLQAILDGAIEVAIVATDPQGLITVFNTGAERMLQYSADEVIGRYPPVMFHSETECRSRSRALSREFGRPVQGMGIFTDPLREHGAEQREWTYVRKDETTLPVCLSTSVIRDATGKITGFLGVASDISAQKSLERELRDRNLKLERGVEERTEKLQRALAEKTVLLKEVHHRVKNNLAIVASLLGLQADADPDGRAIEPLVESQRRVHSMALIHEQLYGTEDLTRIRFDEYAERLAMEIYMTFASPPRIRVNVRAEAIELPIDKAIPCGLILNELISNALKYAFPDGRWGSIEVSFAEHSPGCLTMGVSDDGVGLPESFSWSLAKSLGLKIVQILSKQLGAELSVGEGTGTSFTLAFPFSEDAVEHEPEEELQPA